jgi:hypothetical protein
VAGTEERFVLRSGKLGTGVSGLRIQLVEDLPELYEKKDHRAGYAKNTSIQTHSTID